MEHKEDRAVSKFFNLEFIMLITHYQKIFIVHLPCLQNFLRHFPQRLLSFASKTKSCLQKIIHKDCSTVLAYILPTYSQKNQLFVTL